MDRSDLSQAPLAYQNVAWVRDYALLAQGSLWTIHYAQMVYYSFRDKSYGMALIPLCNNFAWELVYALIYPADDPGQLAVMYAWLGLNLAVMYSAVKFAPNEWSHAPFVRDNMALLIFLGTVTLTFGHVALAQTMGPDQAVFWSAMVCQIVLSVGCFLQLVSRGSSRALSLPLL